MGEDGVGPGEGVDALVKERARYDFFVQEAGGRS